MKIDPAFKRAQFERLKELAGRGKLCATPRKKFTAKERTQVLADYEGRCRACDALVGLKFQIDHRIPLFRGGAHERANWELLCVPCHAEKTGNEAPGNAMIRRVEAREDGTRRPRKAIPNRPWPTESRKLHSRGFEPGRNRG